MFALDLFNTRYEKELNEGAIDNVELRTVEHLLEPLSQRAAEIRTQLRNGNIKGSEMSALEQEYANLVAKRVDIIRGRAPNPEFEKHTPKKNEFNITKPQDECMGYGGIVGEQGIPGNLPPEQIPGKDGLLRGQGRRTYEESELDEQEGDSRVYAARLVFQQIIKAVQDNVDFATITWPDNSSQKLTRNQLWHLVQKARGMSRQARNQFALKVLPTVNDLMYYLGNLKKVDARPQVKMPVDPNQPSLDLPKPLEELAQKKNSEDPDLDSKTARDATVQRELQKMRARQPNARSDIEALVKDELEQQEKTNQELEQLQSVNSQQDAQLKKVLSLNTQQDQEISNLNQELSRLDGKLNQALGKSTQPATTPATAKPTTVAPTTTSTTVFAPSEIPSTGDDKTDQEIKKLQNQIGQLETMMTLKAPSDPAAEERLQQQISKLEAQIEKLNNRPEVTPVALPTATTQTPIGSTPQLPNIEPTTLPAVEVPSVRAGSNDINVGNRRPSATADNDFDILDLGDFDDLVDEPATKKKKKKHSDTTVDRPAGTTPFAGGTKNNQWGPKNMPSGRFTVQDVDPYDIGVHEAVEPGEEMTTNELLYRAAVEYMQHMGREGRPVDYETAIKLAAKHYHIPYRPGMVPELHAKRQELDAKLAAAIAAKQAERASRKQKQLARTTPTTPEQEKRTQDYWSKHAPQATRVKAPTKSLEEDQRLHVGDPVIVTSPNEFEGATGEIYDFAPSGKFVIVNLYNHGKHSMHLSDVEYNQYADDQDEKEFWNGDKEVNESNMSELDAMRQDLELMNDRQFKFAYGISKVAFRQKYRALLNPAPAQDVPVEEGFQDFNKVEPYAVCLAGKPVKKFDYYEQARRFHDNWKKKLYRAGNKEKADKITLMPLNLDEEEQKPYNPNEFRPVGPITIVPPKKLKSGETHQGINDYWKAHGQAPIYKTNEAGSPAQQAAIAIAMKKAGKKPKQADEAYTPSPAKPFRNPRGFNKQGTGVGNKLAQLNRKEWEEKKKKEQGVAEAVPTIQGTAKSQPGADYTGEDLVRDANALFTAGGFKLADKEVEPRDIDDPKKINTTYYWRKKIKGLTPDQGQVQQLMIEIYNYAPKRTYWAINDWANDGARVTPDLAQKLWRRMEKTIKDSIDTAERENYWYSMTGNGKKPKGLTEDTGSWIVYDPETKQIKKRFKTHTAGKSYAQTHGLEFASSEFYFDRVKEPSVAEAETDYSKRRQRERDIDAGRPVKPLPKNPQTDYARKRAKDRKDMELGETHEPQKFIVTINGKATSPLYADMADRLYAAAKRAQPNARIEKTPAPTTQRQKGIDRVKAGYGDEDALELHEQLPSTPPANRKEYLDQRDKLFRMLAVETNPANKQIIKTAIQNLDARYSSAKNPVNEESSTSSEAVEIAVIKRILVAHTDLIMEFGLDKVTQAIEEVAYNVGDVDEIGTSDVSGWVNQVEQILGVEA